MESAHVLKNKIILEKIWIFRVFTLYLRNLIYDFSVKKSHEVGCILRQPLLYAP